MKIKIISVLLVISAFFCLYDFGLSPFPLLSPKWERGLFVTSKAYDQEESKKYLNRDLLSRGYQPIQITIQNNTSSSFYLSTDSVNLPQEATGTIVRKVMKPVLARSIGYKVAGLLFWPLMIPGTIDGIKTIHSYSKLSKEFAAKAVKSQDEMLLPYSTIQRVLFVAQKEFRNAFVLTLVDQQTGRTQDFEMLL
jgi:hypothetical protein